MSRGYNRCLSLDEAKVCIIRGLEVCGYYLFDKVTTTLNGWKSRISQIPCGMTEKRRKCGIIPPKAEWLACLYQYFCTEIMQQLSTIRNKTVSIITWLQWKWRHSHCQCLQHRMNTSTWRSLPLTLSHRASVSVSWDFANGSLPCTVDILEHYDVSAGGKKGRPETTSKPFHNHLNTLNVTITHLLCLSQTIHKPWTVIFSTKIMTCKIKYGVWITNS